MTFYVKRTRYPELSPVSEQLARDLCRARAWAMLYGPVPANCGPESTGAYWFKLGPSAWLEPTRRSARDMMADRLKALGVDR